MTVDKKYQGESPWRYKDNPLEKAFAEAWQKENKPRTGMQIGLMDYMFDPENRGRPPTPVTDRDHRVAATVIQWLGSPVGQNWLAGILATKEGTEVISRTLAALE